MKKIIAVTVLAVALSGCQSMGNKETGGMLGGAALGGLVGSQFGGGSGAAIATTVGVFLGGMAGRSIGASMDANDKQQMGSTFQTALERAPTNQPVEWSNPETGNSGVTVPTSTHKQPDGRYCREYQHKIRVAGELSHSYGTACRQVDGTWEIQ